MRVFLSTAVSLLALGAVTAATVRPAELAAAAADGIQMPGRDQGLCRRAPALRPLGREQDQDQQRNRREGREPMVAYEGTPPPPPMAPPAPAAPDAARTSDESDVVVTGSAVRAPALDSAAPVTAMPAEEGGASSPPADYAGRRMAQPQSGILTAAEHDDLLNPQLYASYVHKYYRDQRQEFVGLPRVDTRRVLTVAVQDDAGRPVPFAAVTLTCADGNRLTMTSMADGTVTFFPELDRLGRSVRVNVDGAGRQSGARTVSLEGAGAQRQVMTLAGARTAGVSRFDLALVVDTTGSMGDEIAYLRSELRAILADLRRSHPQLDLRIAMVAYRDVGDDYVTRTYRFTGNLDDMQQVLARTDANGGGDYPEAMDQALHRAVDLDWRPDAIRSVLLVADAPPHNEHVGRTWAVAEAARARRIHITPVAASGVADEAEYVMRAMAAATQSRYLFLTDDSGVGNAHAEPSVDCYLVTRLDSLVRRVLEAQISGRRIEPRDGEVIRRVGDYDAGRCILPRNFDPQA